MDRQIIVFSGMPASGKDTVTIQLCDSHREFTAFKKFRAIEPGQKKKDTYYNVSVSEFEEKIRNGDFLQYHGRYGRYYGIAEKTLLEYFDQNLIPIIHIGRIENYYVLCDGISQFEKKYGVTINLHHVLLWETQEVLIRRIIERDKLEDEIANRIAAMKQEFEDNVVMMKNGEKPFSIVIKNENAVATSEMIYLLTQNGVHRDGYEEFWRYLEQL